MKENKVNILLVEDNEDDIILIQEAFRDMHLINLITVARNGGQALKFLKGNRGKSELKPGLILLDINMPGMNGFELLDLMKNDEELRGIPVVMLTTSSREEDIVRSYEKGACTFIRKPVNYDQFCSVVQHFSKYWSLVASLPGEETN